MIIDDNLIIVVLLVVVVVGVVVVVAPLTIDQQMFLPSIAFDGVIGLIHTETT